jgi:uncharacterized membrane protein
MCDKKSDPVLTDYDITINSIHQENMFKGTIAVCIVYAIFAFILVTAAYFSDNIRELLFDKFLPFTLVYIIGTIVIIMIFIYYIVSFVPKKVDTNKIDDSISCPDYWKLEILDDKAIEKSFDIDNFNKKLFKYRCVMDDTVFNKGTIYKQDKKNKINVQYRLGNKPAFISKVGMGSNDVVGDTTAANYNDIYKTDDSTLNNFIANAKDNDKYFYLYKNLNAYNGSNLIYTNNKNVSGKILGELKESALIMNNYKYDNTTKDDPKYVDITNSGYNLYDGTDGDANTGLSGRYTSNYYNSPAILTWATSDAQNANYYSSAAYINNVIGATANAKYTATVYDWSTMTDKTLTGKVYAIDTASSTYPNHILLGEIIYDVSNNLYFKGNSSITITASTFVTKISNNDYYFDTTYFLNSDPTSPAFTLETLKTSKRGTGPKIRLFHKTERQPKIPKSSLNISTSNIPLTCSVVYPSFLASKEDKFSENNTLRCAYSKICNIPWSDLHCNEISLD